MQSSRRGVEQLHEHAVFPDTLQQVSVRQVIFVPLGTVCKPGTNDASVLAPAWGEQAVAEVVTAQLAEYDDELLEQWVRHDRPATATQLSQVLSRLTRRAELYPVLFGSARTGAGIPYLLDTLVELLPPEPGDATALVSGQVFKIERTPASDRVCSIRLRAGTLSVRDVVDLGPERTGTVTALEVHEPGRTVSQRQAVAGQIARVHGLNQAQVGDWVGPGAQTMSEMSFPAPALQTAIMARDARQQGELHRAMTDLAGLDPLIRLRPNDQHGGLQISVYGEVLSRSSQTLSPGSTASTLTSAPPPLSVSRGLRVELQRSSAWATLGTSMATPWG